MIQNMDFGLDEGGGKRDDHPFPHWNETCAGLQKTAELGFWKGSEGRMSKRETDRERESVGYVGAWIGCRIWAKFVKGGLNWWGSKFHAKIVSGLAPIFTPSSFPAFLIKIFLKILFKVHTTKWSNPFYFFLFFFCSLILRWLSLLNWTPYLLRYKHWIWFFL